MLNFKRNPYFVYGLGALVLFLVIALVYSLWYKKSSSSGNQRESITGGNPSSVQQPQNRRPPPRLRPQQDQNPEQNRGIMKPPPPPPSEVDTPIGDGAGALVLFYSEKCGHSVNMMPEWEKMKNVLGSTNQVDIIGLEQSKNPQEMQQHDVKGFPTIHFYPEGFPSPNFIEYRGPRTAESFIKFVQSGGQEV